ncbi:MAG: hypothetical protein ACJAUR_002151 [Ulvibacter sp.]|jgi:hypothetical protein
MHHSHFDYFQQISQKIHKCDGKYIFKIPDRYLQWHWYSNDKLSKITII